MFRGDQMGYQLNTKVDLQTVFNALGIPFQHEPIYIEGVSSLANYSAGTLTFCNKDVDVPNQAIVISSYQHTNAHVIHSATPRKVFVQVLDWLDKNVGFDLYNEVSQIHPSVQIGPNVVIESGCIIEENVVIEPNVVIHKGTIIKKGSRIRSSASVGSDGFGFERMGDNQTIRFAHLGRVILGENVEIGACTTVARGTLSDTVIGNNVKIDNLVHVAHNVRVGDGALITACAEISGSVEVGENVWISPNVSIREKLKIGANVLIGIGAVVTKSILDDTVVAGNPARPIVKKD